MDIDGRGQMISTANAFTKRVLMVALGPIAAGLLVATICGADQSGDAPDGMTVSAELKELTDPTILIPRIWLETEWNKFTDGTQNVEETLGGLWSWRLSPDLWTGLSGSNCRWSFTWRATRRVIQMMQV
jgi:hypothetical protein